MFRYAVLGVAVAGAVPAPAHAQGKLGALTYSWSMPADQTKQYADNDSWLGLTVEGRAMQDRTSVGILLGWNSFYNRTSQTINLPQGAITGDQYRSLQIFPLLANAHLYFGETRAPRMYVGVNAGAYYVHQVLDIGLSSLTTDNWHFGVAPEVGFMIPKRGRFGAVSIINVRYHYPLEGGDYLGGQALTLPYWT
ncbi:MAG: hypothetical protein ACRD08_08155, partial [Acidimicrobiales bacterium]